MYVCLLVMNVYTINSIAIKLWKIVYYTPVKAFVIFVKIATKLVCYKCRIIEPKTKPL